MVEPEITFRFGFSLEYGRRFSEPDERPDVSSLFFPLFHSGRVADDLDLALIFRKAHSAAEPLFIQSAQFPLIIVMIGGPKNGAAESTTRDAGKIAFHWLGLRQFDPVKL